MSSVLGKVSPHSWIHRLLFPSFMSFRLQLTTIDFLHALSCVLLFVWKTSILLSHLVRKMAVSGGGDWWQWFYIYTCMDHGYAGSCCMIWIIKKSMRVCGLCNLVWKNTVLQPYSNRFIVLSTCYGDIWTYFLLSLVLGDNTIRKEGSTEHICLYILG